MRQSNDIRFHAVSKEKFRALIHRFPDGEYYSSTPVEGYEPTHWFRVILEEGTEAVWFQKGRYER